MFIVDLGQRKLAFAFSHPFVKEEKKKRGQPTRYTLCEIFEILPNGATKSLGERVTGCSLKDNFCKETGRKRVLALALCQHVFNIRTQKCKKCGARFSAYGILRLSKIEREKIWKAYLGRPRRDLKSTKPKEETLAPVVPQQIPAENLHGLGYCGAD